MLKIYLARHGQDWDNFNGILNGRRNEPLTKKGQEQALEVAKKIKVAKIKFDKTYTSPLIRTRETAEIITKTLGLPKPVIMNDLIERDFGIMTGQLQSKIVEMCAPDILPTESGINYFLSPKGAETFPQLIERGKKLISEIVGKHKNEKVLLVSHGDIGKMIYAAYYNLNWRKVLKMFHFGNSDLLLLSSDSPADKAHVFKIKQHNL